MSAVAVDPRPRDLAAPKLAPSERITSIDIARGAVMVLMALDHVRVYSGLPPGGPTYGIFFTRWVTHFCAPAFFFLAGTGAFLRLRKRGDRAEMSRFLVTRGLFLVVLELTILRFFWTFNFDYSHYLLAGVIWALGWCMVLLAAILWLPLPVVAVASLAVIGGHNLLPPPHAGISGFAQILYYGGPVGILAVLYVIVPWVAVMSAGFAFGAIVRRRDLCVGIGLGAIALFLILRGIDAYGDPRHWHSMPAQVPFVIRFLNTTKYPASLDYLLMTLGPAILILPFLPPVHGVTRVLDVFGRVPLFFYALHIPLIHVMACVVSLIRSGAVHPWLFTNHPMMNPEPPAGYTWSLGLLYLVWIIAIVLLWPVCQWYAKYKATHRSPWLSYL
ncbi:MAG TPA: heparan-alpha-glucosaminide N-acetyltransferase domain-containing protein [Gemmatimonadaceae bacterium]|nr:heparan-alpha-glucosaminide N-acetyltransferase domain-containing protein [Gemmatimonadaceae bacterium]